MTDKEDILNEIREMEEKMAELNKILATAEQYVKYLKEVAATQFKIPKTTWQKKAAELRKKE